MEALCASLLFCLLLSLGAGWAQSQLTIADQLAADTLRLHMISDFKPAQQLAVGWRKPAYQPGNVIRKQPRRQSLYSG